MLTFLLDATGERISSKARRATTNRVVIDNLAPSVDAAGTGTGVDALLFDTGSVLSTVWADHALRPACRGRAHEASEAWAHGVPVDLSTLTVRATRWRLTRVLWRLSCRRKEHMQSHRAEEKIKNKSDSETRKKRCLIVGAYISSFKINCTIEIRLYFI